MITKCMIFHALKFFILFLAPYLLQMKIISFETYCKWQAAENQGIYLQRARKSEKLFTRRNLNSTSLQCPPYGISGGC